MKNILDWIEENKQQFEGHEPRYASIPDAFDPDLEQSEFLRPGETLEDWKPNPFLKPHAEGGRAGYNDGQLVRSTVDGSRPGYQGKPHGGARPGSGQPTSPTSKAFVEYVRGLDKKKTAKLNIDELIKMSNVDIKRDTALTQLRYNNPDIKFNFTKQGTDDPRTRAKIKKIQLEKVKVRTNTIKKVNNWTDKWFKNNASDFKDYDSAKKQLIKAWTKESKNKIYKGYNLTTVDGLPNIASGSYEGTGATKVSDTIFDLNFPTQRPNKELIFQKGYANYRLQNPKFAKKLNNYFDLILMDKRGFGVQQMLIQEGKLKEGYGLIRRETGDFGKGSKSMKGKKALEALNIDREVLDFVTTYMAKDSPYFTKTGGENIYDILGKHIDPEKVATYKNKMNVGTDQWRKNLEDVVKLANKDLPPPKHLSVDAIRSQMKKESKKMAKLFNLKDLPAELKYFGYSQDHLLGIREALESGDSRIARQTLKTIAAATRAQNTFLGFNEFGNQRRQLMKDFNAAPKNARGPIIEKLNTLSEEFVPGKLKYNVRKDGSLKINVLQPEKTFKARATAYGEIVKTLPKTFQEIVKNSKRGGALLTHDLLSKSKKYKKINICKTEFSSGGGGLCGKAFADADPQGYLEKVMKDSRLTKYLQSKEGLTAARSFLDKAAKVGRWANPLTLVGGEAWYSTLAGINEYSKGASLGEAINEGLWFIPGKHSRDLDMLLGPKTKGKAGRNLPVIPNEVRNQFDLLTQLGGLINEEGKLSGQLQMQKWYEADKQNESDRLLHASRFDFPTYKKNIAAQGRTDFFQDMASDINWSKTQITPQIEKRLADVGVKGEDVVQKYQAADPTGQSYSALQDRIKNFIVDKYNRGKGWERADPYSGSVWNAIKRGWQGPQHLLGFQLRDEPGLWEKQKELDYKKLTGQLPDQSITKENIPPELIENFLTKFPEYSYIFEGASGGRAGYMGGGIAGIRRPNAVAPDSGPMDQGLRSLYINDKDY